MRTEPPQARAALPPLTSPRGRYVTIGILLAILLVAAGLRVVYLTSTPPGLNQDEAANAWNAWCLLKTGTDQVGAPWPIFYTRAIGDNRSTLFLYLMLPFQALGGLNVWTARLPAAVGGILTVLLLYWIAARLFDRPTGLAAAALLALAPWHVALSRLAFEAAVGPLLTALSFAALLWAGFPLTNRQTQPIPWRAALAGLCIGISCYGYPAVRLFLPIFLAGCVLVTLPSWWQLARTRRGLTSLIALTLGIAITFGPLIYYHIAHADIIGKRAAYNWLWNPDDPLSVRLTKVIGRYFSHFGPEFLWTTGDHYEMLSPPAPGVFNWGTGVLHWYTVPLLLAGLIALVRGVRKSRATRLLLWFVLAFPAGDLLNTAMVLTRTASGAPLTISMHVLRSAPGLNALILLAAVGAVAAGRLLWRRRPVVLAVTGGVFTFAAVALCDVPFLRYYFGPYGQRPVIYRSFHVDELDAWNWVRPRLDTVDAVFLTGTAVNQPYVVALVALGYDPQQWFHQPRDIRAAGEWDNCYRAGKLYFDFLADATNAQIVDEMRTNNRRERVFFIVRDGELHLPEPAYMAIAPNGSPALIVYEAEL